LLHLVKFILAFFITIANEFLVNGYFMTLNGFSVLMNCLNKILFSVQQPKSTINIKKMTVCRNIIYIHICLFLKYKD